MGLSWVGGTLASSAYSLTTSAVIYHGIRHLPAGFPRLLASIPILFLNAFVPWVFDPSTHMLGTCILFCVITWIKSFRLVMFCFGIGPLCRTWVLARFVRFLVILTIPVHIKLLDPQVKGADQQAPPAGRASEPYQASNPAKVPKPGPSHPGALSRILALFEGEAWPQLIARGTAKTVLMVLVMSCYKYRSVIPPFAIHMLYALNLYLFVTIVLEFLGVFGTLVGGVQLEPFFDRPYLSSSFAELWAKRWNILVSTLLRESVYEPTLAACLGAGSWPIKGQGGDMGNVPPGQSSKPEMQLSKDQSPGVNGVDTSRVRRRGRQGGDERAHGVGVDETREKGESSAHRREEGELRQTVLDEGIGRKNLDTSRAVATLAAFFVSGVAHEFAVFYMIFRVTGEMTLFFLLHGVFVVCERAMGVRMSREGEVFGVRKALKVLFTIGLTLLTAEFLFWAPLVRHKVDLEVIKELEAVAKGIEKLVFP